MSTFFNYDPLTGVREDFFYNEETGEAKILHSQNIESAVELAKFKQNTGIADNGIKNGMWNYATLSAIDQIKLRAMGIDITSKDIDMQNRMLKAIDEHFPHCKNTTKKHRLVQNRHI